MTLNPQAKQLWTEIRNPDCTDCPLHKEAQTVCLVGDGPVPAKLMVVGEAPGFREDEIQKPFAGRAGKLLDSTLEEVGLSREDIFITNVVKCRPPDNRTPTKGEIKACRKYLDAELEAVQPEIIMTVGNSGLSVIKKSGITKHRGELFDFGESRVLPTFHPAAVLRNPRYESAWKADVGTFARLSRGERGAKPPKVYLVQNKKMLVVAIKTIFASEAVAYDFETSGFDDHSPDGKIAVISVSPKEGVSFVIPIHHPESRWKRPERVLSAIGNALMFSKAKLIAHNAKFDDRWFHRYDLKVHADFDTMIAAHILEENRFKGLKPLAQILLGADPWKDVDLDKGGALKEPLKKLSPYAAKDTHYTLMLYRVLKEQLLRDENRRLLRLFKLILMPVSKVLTNVERHGMWIDKERLMKRTLAVEKRLDKIDDKLVEITGEEANWNSPQQLGRVMFEKLGLPLIEVTKTGNPSTKESVLLQLKKEHKVAALILEWRKWFKYHSTYLKRWAEVTDERGRIHPNYKITGTVTGRLSSGKEEGSRGPGLNVQQVPRDKFIRGIIGAPPGWNFVEADFSQVELRIAAHYSSDPTMRRYFQLGRDIHLETAVSMTGKPPSDVEKEERKKAKAVNFGFLYGMGAPKFVTYARDSYEVEVELDEAKRVRNRFFETYTALRPWHQRQRRLARRYQKVQSAIGRVRHLPDIDSSDEEVRAEAERQAINSPVQSLASDLMLLSMVLLHERMDPSEAVIVGTVHDSILFEIRKDVTKRYTTIIREVMENLPLKKKFGVELSVPIVADITVGQHWGEGKEI